MLEKFLEKANLKLIGQHLKNYVDLYFHPIEQWRKALSNRKTGYDLIIQHIFYYFIIILLIIEELSLAIKILLLELGTTILPFLIFLVPFNILRKKYAKKISSKHLFRLMLILRMQLLPIIIIITYVQIYTDYEGMYIILNNFIWIFWLLSIVVIPLVQKLNKKQKITWIIANYLSINLIFNILGFIPIKIKTRAIDAVQNIVAKFETPIKSNGTVPRGYYNTNLYYKDLAYDTPDLEYAAFRLNYAECELNNYFYVALIKEGKSGMSTVLPLYHSQKVYDLLTKTQSDADKSNLFSQKNVINEQFSRKYFTIDTLDSIRKIFTKKFIKYKNTVNVLKDVSNFESNQRYFRFLSEYLSTYEKAHVDYDLIDTIIKRNPLALSIEIQDSFKVFVYKLDETKDYYKSNAVQKIEEEFEMRHLLSDLFMRIVLFPSRTLNVFYDILGLMYQHVRDYKTLN